MSDVLDDHAPADAPDADVPRSRARRLAPLVVGVIAVLMVGLFVVLAGASPDDGGTERRLTTDRSPCSGSHRNAR